MAIFGDAETKNAQGNDNTATADVDQSNSVDQSQSSYQKQSLEQSGTGCCDGQSQTAEQKVYGGDQSVAEQKNTADVNQFQGNGNVNVAPAIALFGDAETTNAQGNGNTATADVDQSNSVDQSQSSYQKQSLEQSGTGCCDGQSQTAEQKVYGGDQSVDKQRNDADVNQWQGNGNVNVAPAIAVFGDAETRNYQGNQNTADADVTQSNDASQSQSSAQKQYLEGDGGSCCKPSYGCKPEDPCKPNGYERSKKDRCCEGGSTQAAEQKTSFGDQHVGEQKNSADVSQKQGNGNVSFAPALALGGGQQHSCRSKCGKSWGQHGGNAETTNKQGNGNEATANVGQTNSVDQTQTSYQRQVIDVCKGLIYR